MSRRCARRFLPAGALAAAILLACGRGKTSGEGKGPAGEEPAASAATAPGPGAAGDLAADDRIAWLLAPCERRDPFLLDTGDPVALLVQKLAHGQVDPLRQAKTDLVELGEAALPELRRFAERQRGKPDGSIPLLNVLAIAGSMPTDAGRDLLLAGLTEAQETLRLEAIRGLGKHARAEDYDRLMALVPVSSADVLRELCGALDRADHARFEDDFAAWLGGAREHPALFADAPVRVASTKRPEILARFREVYAREEGELRAYLAAALAAAGDESALALLRDDMKDGNPTRRTLAVRALVEVGRTADCAALLWEDRDETLRAIVAGTIADLPPSPQTMEWLRRGLLDRVGKVRQICLRALVLRGDEPARDEVLRMLAGDRGELEDATAALRGAWSEDAALAARSLEMLLKLRRGEIQPVRVGPASLDHAIGQVPLAAAAAHLLEMARRTQTKIDGLPAHRWYLMQAGNTGRPGRRWLSERWAEEDDPARRVDIVMAVSYGRDEASRRFLLEVVEDDRTSPLEILHAANLLVHQGPASVIAPRLKRVALRVTDARVRPALNCLLWGWYGEGA